MRVGDRRERGGGVDDNRVIAGKTDVGIHQGDELTPSWTFFPFFLLNILILTRILAQMQLGQTSL